MGDLLLRRRAMMADVDKLLTFKAQQSNSTVKIMATGNPTAISLEYNNGNGWNHYNIGDVINLANIGDKVKFRGTNATFSIDASNYYIFVMTGTIAASGDVTSLLNGVGGDVALSPYCFRGLFMNCTSLTIAPRFPSTTLSVYCYFSAFSGCRYLAIAPELRAEILEEGCYNSMFYECRSLVTAPELPALTLINGCYRYMFYNCNDLNFIKAMFLTAPSTSHTMSWVYGVSGSGTFVKNSAATWTDVGTNAVPNGWIIETEDA